MTQKYKQSNIISATMPIAKGQLIWI